MPNYTESITQRGMNRYKVYIVGDTYSMAESSQTKQANHTPEIILDVNYN